MIVRITVSGKPNEKAIIMLTKIPNVPVTYYGLAKILSYLRSNSLWIELTARQDYELLLALQYFGLSIEDMRTFETNDYLRQSLGRTTPLPANYNVLGVNAGQDIQVLDNLCAFPSSQERTGNCDIGWVDRVGYIADASRAGFVSRFFYMSDDLVDVRRTTFYTDPKFEAILSWINNNKCTQLSLLNPSILLKLNIVILNALHTLSSLSNFPEFGLFKRSEIKDTTLTDLERDGYAIVEGFCSPEEIKTLREITYKIAEEEANSERGYFYGADNTLQRVYGLSTKAREFQEIFLGRSGIFELLMGFFPQFGFHQPFYLSSYQANILYPGARPQVLHVDSSVPDPLPPWKIRLNINLNLDDFTEFNGSTLVWPGSHKYLRKPRPEDCNQTFMRKIIAPAGSLIIWTGHLWHQSGGNETQGARAALLACFCASYLREVSVEENYARVMSAEDWHFVTEDVRLLMGYQHGLKLRGRQHSNYR